MYRAWACACLLVLHRAQANASGPCVHEEGTCLTDDRDMTSMLQHPLYRVQTRTNVVMMNAENSTKPRKRNLVPARKAVPETARDCEELMLVLRNIPFLDEAAALWSYICSDGGRDRLSELRDGCLYLPDDRHLNILYDNVDHPNPWHIVDLFEDSFFRARATPCPTENPGSRSYTLEGTAVMTCNSGSGFAGVDGACIRANLVGRTPAVGSNVRVYKLDGLMGLDQTWEDIIMASGERNTIWQDSKGAKDGAMKWKFWPFTSIWRYVKNAFGWSSGTATVAAASKEVQMRIRYYVCDGDSSGRVSKRVTDQMLQAQTVLLNRAYAGEDQCQGSTTYSLKKADSGFRFVQEGIVRLTDPRCASDCSERIKDLAGAFAKRENGLIKVVLCETQLLGIASFPHYPDDERVCIANPDTLPGGALSNYNLGKTLAHEMGHYLGLYHTFQGGCDDDEGVRDTSPEKKPNFGCPSFRVNTCGKGSDPVHNLMDYSDDRCICAFTKGQVQQMWSALQRDQPDLLTVPSR